MQNIGNTRDPKIDLGLEIMNLARLELANETGLPPQPINSRQIADIVGAVTESTCTTSAINYYSNSAMRKLRSNALRFDLDQF